MLHLHITIQFVVLRRGQTSNCGRFSNAKLTMLYNSTNRPQELAPMAGFRNTTLYLISPLTGCSIAMAVVLSTFAITGVVGNTIILLVYHKRKEKLVANYFIQALALIDLVACALVIPWTIVLDMSGVFNDPMCKMAELIRHLTISASTLTMVGVAVERYIAICRPTKTFTPRHGKNALLGIFVASFLASLPASTFFEVDFKLSNGVTIYLNCQYSPAMIGTVWNYLYNAVLVIIFFGGIVTMTVLYSKIFKVVVERTQRKNARVGIAPIEAPHPSQKASTAFPSNSVNEDDVSAIDMSCERRRIKDSTTKTPKTPSRSAQYKTAVMLFAVTIIYFVSWLPFWLTVFNLFSTECRPLIRYFFFINNASNVLVYSIVNKTLRDDMKRLLTCKLYCNGTGHN